ncbi:MAG: hypothetical protein A2Y25_05420 [Candidatus Melainabacteria bacterium GWF2_37_15]|nr:MAG: hypothetical protein A2Y25_05420 [Candidatus Melainabacteria bacterium GWF2_37_15]
MKNCPFGHKECTKECALFVDPEELNEVVRNKLASVGVMSRDKGMCAFKNLSLCLNRILYEELT